MSLSLPYELSTVVLQMSRFHVQRSIFLSSFFWSGSELLALLEVFGRGLTKSRQVITFVLQANAKRRRLAIIRRLFGRQGEF